jgi:RNA polymerase sigma factor (sigma-70 family)
MAASLGHVLAQLERWTSPRLCELSDAVLLERYIQDRDESAFAALVSRHGDMVLHSCRRILDDAHEAEDAFQATFLILARKAPTLRQPATLPGFLHRVARRVALKVLRKAVVRGGREALAEEISDAAPDPLARLTARELLTVLDEEVARLPMMQRSAVMLCCLEGRTQEEAARLLGWTPGSLRGHLERGRHRLQARLLRRGIGLSAALAVAAVSHGEAASTLLLRGTVAAALSGGSGSAAALAQSLLQTMLVSKLAATAAVVLTMALAASVAVRLTSRGPVAEAPDDKAPPIPVVPTKAEPSKPPLRTDTLGDPLPPRAVARMGSLRLYHGEQVHHVALSADGKWVISTALNGNRLWDAASGKELPLREELRKAAFFATRDKLIAVEKSNLNLQLWDVIADKKIGCVLPADKLGQLNSEIHLGFPSGYAGIALAPDGRTLVVGNLGDVGAGVQRVLRFCDLDKGKVEEPVALELSRGSQTRMVFSADSKTLVVQCDDATIHIWDAASRTEKMKSRASKDDFGGQIALSPNGKILATAWLAGKRVRLWDTRTLKELPPLLKQPEEFMGCIAFSQDGKQLAASSITGPTIRIWDLASRKEVKQFQGKAYQIFHMVFSTDGKYLVAGDGESVTFMDAATGKYRHDFGHTYCVDSVAFSPDGKRLVSGAAYTDNMVHIWDSLSGKETAQLRGHEAGIEVVAYSPDGKLIATGSQDGTVRIWDAASNREVRRLDAKEGMVYAMAFAPDGKTLASSGWRKAFHLWDVATGRELRSVPNPGNHVLRLAFAPVGTMLATRDTKEIEIRLWDAVKGVQIRALKGPAAGCPSLTFSPDGKVLAAGGDDATVHFWDVQSGEELRSLAVPLQPGEAKRVLSVAFSPDGHSLAAGYGEGDYKVRVLELASGCERLRFEGHPGTVACLAFSPDGTLLASGGTDHIVMVWDVLGQRTTHLPLKGRLRPEQGNALWKELANADAAKAYRAMQTLLAAGGQAVSILKEHLRPAAAVDGQRIDRLIADLDGDSFDVREKAAEELRKIGEDAEPALKKVLAGKPTAEQRLRVKQLLQQIDAARSPEYLRGVRAVEVLERLGTSDARQVLQMLAEGGAQALLTREAKAALQRLMLRHERSSSEPDA